MGMDPDEVDRMVAGGSAARTDADSDNWGEDEPLEFKPGWWLWLMAAGVVVALVVGGVKWAMAEEPPVDQNLVTALDVSSSINAQETMLQIEGLAQAIRSPAVVSAIENGKLGRIGFSVFVWADGEYPELCVWRSISNQAEADAVATEIIAGMQAAIAANSKTGTLTNLSGALDHAALLLSQAPWPAARHVINIVGNGEDNVGEDPTRVRAALVARGATINGVVVGGDPDVMAYYRTSVIGGRYAFVLPAKSADDMASAFIAKFVTEIAMVPSNNP